MFRRLFLIATFSLTAIMFVIGGSSAQKKPKPYSQWESKDVEKMLTDSPWAQTQVETDTSEMMYQPTSSRTTSVSGDRLTRGATNQATSVKYHVMFLSARPIREAIFRRVAMAQRALDQQLSSQLLSFVERDFSEYIVVSVTFETSDPRFANAPNQAFAGALTRTIKNNTYLDRSDGKRAFLLLYIPPIDDDLGAKFVFARKVDERLFLDERFAQVRFYSELSKTVKIDRKFRVSDMKYDGKLEY